MKAPAPHEAVALAEQGLQAQLAGNHADAVVLYRRALPALPEVPELYNNLGACHLALGQPGLAEPEFQHAVRLRPSYAEAWNNRGQAAQALRQPDDAQAHYRRAIEIDPAKANPRFNLGTLLLQIGRAAEAETAFAEAVRIDPAFAKAHRNLGLARIEQNDVAGATAAFDEACRLDPDDAEAHCNRALAFLLKGDFGRGWAEYEWRWRLPETRPIALPIPAWNGEELSGKTILLWTEQGAGTSIQFIRYAPLLAACGTTVVVAAPAPLQRLLASAAGVDGVLDEQISLDSSRADFHLPLVSLARALHTDAASIPPPASFSLPSTPRREGPLRVGLAWAGNSAHANDGARSMPLKTLFPLAQIDRIEWIPFQLGAAAAEWKNWPGLAGATPRLGDFRDTAEALRDVDFVIGVDSAVAHLAGSLGKPVSLLLPFAPDWRWGLGTERTAWYPTATLFRQTVARQWDQPVAAVARHLEAWQVSSRA